MRRTKVDLDLVEIAQFPTDRFDSRYWPRQPNEKWLCRSVLSAVYTQVPAQKDVSSVSYRFGTLLRNVGRASASFFRHATIVGEGPKGANLKSTIGELPEEFSVPSGVSVLERQMESIRSFKCS